MIISELTVGARSTGLPLSQACSGKCVVRFTDKLSQTLAVDWDVKQQAKQNKRNIFCT